MELTTNIRWIPLKNIEHLHHSKNKNLGIKMYGDKNNDIAAFLSPCILGFLLYK